MTELPEESHFVLDGGALLHKVVWRPNSSYGEVIQQYQSYVRKYGTCTTVFDGYGHGPSTKDHEHQRRSKTSKQCPDVTVNENVAAYDRTSIFLSNESNKSQFVELLNQHLVSDGHTVKKSDGDADTLIVSSAIEATSVNIPVVVVADDTDVLVMLLHFSALLKGENIILREAKGATGIRRLIQINDVAEKLERPVLDRILEIHAWGGCDTTSAFGKGKFSILKLVQKSEEVQRLMTIFSDESATQQEIASVGARICHTLWREGN